MYLNISKAKKLGWSPKTNIDLGIEKTISWWHENIK